MSDEIKQALEERLAAYCYGRVRADEDPDYYSFELTVAEFFRLYDNKPDKTKLGLAGELVVHLLLPHGHDHLESACLYLNKEEHNVKKGFDLTFRDRNDGGLWYGEVKSGRVTGAQTADDKARERIGEAERGLDAMFTSNVERKRWDAAILDAEAALSGPSAASVKDLLRADFKTINQGSPAKVRALLCAVVMHPFDLSEIDAGSGQTLIDGVKSRGRFEDIRILLIQQSDLELLIEVLRASWVQAEAA
ncbi:hypothetical protein [Paramicrobacterium agarici]|uniref:hypothetical protein n=1 Tax=Paramicrobacterium agarici TaxID=630514 RepID=UPI001152F316|nr:hypothetical protein [Microbacterium agarici]